MRLLASIFGCALLLSGCSTAPEETPATPDQPAEAAPVVSASIQVSDGTCAKCHSKVYDDHQCGRTHPCVMCHREAGAGHRHNLVWTCGPCQRTYLVSHVCNDARTCPTCRPDSPRRTPPKSCAGCGGILSAIDSRPATMYCSTCNLEAGLQHVHGKTAYCATCEREAGAHHIHEATIMCAACGNEVAPDHQHGVTAFCPACGLDQGINHKHGRTVWCVRCKGEKVDPHTVHVQ